MDHQDQARGLMVGLAAGNLLGIRYEGGWSAADIRREFPDGIREIHAKPGFPDDDDLAQAIVLAEASAAGDLDLDDLGRRFWEWGERNGGGMGSHTKQVLCRYGGDWPQRLQRNEAQGGTRWSSEAPREPRGVSAADASYNAWLDSYRPRHDDYNAGNGAVMRCPPLAIRWRDDDTVLVRKSILSAVVTHWDPRCSWSVLLVNLAAASCLRAETELIDAKRLLARAAAALRNLPAECDRFNLDPAQPPEPILDALDLAFTPSISADALELEHPFGYTTQTLKAALWAAHQPDNLEDGLSAIVSAGGDTDTNGAAAGALLGARFGLSGIPIRWRKRIAEIRVSRGPYDDWPPRPPLEEYADRLLDACLERNPTAERDIKQL